METNPYKEFGNDWRIWQDGFHAGQDQIAEVIFKEIGMALSLNKKGKPIDWYYSLDYDTYQALKARYLKSKGG